MATPGKPPTHILLIRLVRDECEPLSSEESSEIGVPEGASGYKTPPYAPQDFSAFCARGAEFLRRVDPHRLLTPDAVRDLIQYAHLEEESRLADAKRESLIRKYQSSPPLEL